MHLPGVWEGTETGEVAGRRDWDNAGSWDGEDGYDTDEGPGGSAGEGRSVCDGDIITGGADMGGGKVFPVSLKNSAVNS